MKPIIRSNPFQLREELPGDLPLLGKLPVARRSREEIPVGRNGRTPVPRQLLGDTPVEPRLVKLRGDVECTVEVRNRGGRVIPLDLQRSGPA